MNYRSRFALIVLLAHCPALFAMQALENKQQQVMQQLLQPTQTPKTIVQRIENISLEIPTPELTSRRLIICFDPHSVEGDLTQSKPAFIVTSALVDALASKSAIVITTARLWHYLMSAHSSRGVSISDVVLQKLWISLNFKPEEWRVYFTAKKETAQKRGAGDTTVGGYAPDDGILVFIPNVPPYENYIKKLPDESFKGISTSDRLLGIKTNNLWKLPYPTKPRTSFALTSEHSDDLVAYLNNILVTKNDLKDGYDNTPWDIVLIGHGETAAGGKEPEIAGMSLNGFSTLLSFLNDKINTRIFFYNSCYAGGNLKVMETPAKQERQNQLAKDFNFLIIASTIFDLPSTGVINIPTIEGDFVSFNAPEIDIKNKISFDFAQYFKDLSAYNIKTDPHSTLAPIIKLLNPWHLSYEKSEIAMQIPAIRYPHIGWFSALDLDKQLFRLNNMKIMRTLDKPINERSIEIPADTKIILLETRYIPIRLIITGEDIPLLMPIDFTAPYFFKEIKAENVDLVGHFLGLGQTQNTLKDMLKLLNHKTRNLLNHNTFFIETLRMTLNNKNSLNWGGATTDVSTFKNVVINPMQSISLTYAPEGKPEEQGSYNLKTQVWGHGGPSINFQEIKEAIRNTSFLPETFETQQIAPHLPVLFGTYERYKDDLLELEEWKKTLSQEDKEKLKAYIKVRK